MVSALRLEANGNEVDVPLAYIEEAIAFAVAHGWRPPGPSSAPETRETGTIPVPLCVRRSSEAGAIYDAVERRNGLSSYSAGLIDTVRP